MMSYTHLNVRERMSIFYLEQFGLSLREISRRLNRSHSTISRELKRNARPLGMCYSDETAQTYADQGKAKARHKRKQNNHKLHTYVLNQLDQGWSPEIISNRIKKDFPYRKQMRISSEGIYQWVYKDVSQGGELYKSLTLAHKKRKKQRRYSGVRAHIPNRVDIDKRPKIVSQRRRFGDWEGDTMVGARRSGRLVTHVERKSRYLLVAKTKDGTCSSFNSASNNLFNPIPKPLCKTLTLDNGSENAAWQDLAKEQGFNVYFAKPYASWERGTNENTNGLLRRYFPKGTDFKSITDKELAKAADRLNNRPRKCLNYRTPLEVFRKAMSGALRT